MLADNALYLKKNYPILYEQFKESENENQNEVYVLEDTKNNQKTIRIQKNGTVSYLHSKYDPIREAVSIVDSLEENENIDENTHVIFYGLGLGYHIDEFINRFPNVSYSLYEPSKEIFKLFLNYKNLKDMKVKNLKILQCEVSDNAMADFFSELLNTMEKKTIILDLPVYKNSFASQFTKFSNCLLELIKNKRNKISVNLIFQKRWILNSVINLKTVLNTPNLLMLNENRFANKIAILVAAGPSLDFEIENLRTIKENGSAFIFCVGSAINALLVHNIYPDAICTYDPSEENNRLVFKKINDMCVNTLPLIFGSSVGFEVLESYTGPKYHMITNQDTIANYFLKTKNTKDIQNVHDAPSIAVVTLELLKRLDFSRVILVGQNLAYMEEKNYANGIDYAQKDAFESENNIVIIKDVLGNDVSTTASFNSMRSQMELYIKSLDISVINTTIGGACIAGTDFMEMKDVIKNILTEKIVSGNEFKQIEEKPLYDCEFLQNSLKRIEDAYKTYKTMLFDIKRQISKIKELINNYNKKQTGIMYEKLDDLLKRIEMNDFFKVVAMPMNRVQYQLLIDNTIRLQSEKNELKRFKETVIAVDSFIDSLFIDESLNQNIIEILKTTVNEYYEKTNENDHYGYKLSVKQGTI